MIENAKYQRSECEENKGRLTGSLEEIDVDKNGSACRTVAEKKGKKKIGKHGVWEKFGI